MPEQQHEIGQYLIYDVIKGRYWSGRGWTKSRDKAEPFAYRYFAEQACLAFNGGKGMRIEKK